MADVSILNLNGTNYSVKDTTARSAANSANSTAQAAQTAATTAQATAKAAQTTAESANSTANTAKNTADSANSTAQAAQTAAGNALERTYDITYAQDTETITFTKYAE